MAVIGLAMAVSVAVCLASEPALAADLHQATVSAGQHTGPMLQFDIAEPTEPTLFANVVRYGRYFVTVMLGTGYMMVKPIQGALSKNPVSAAFAVAGVIGAFIGAKITLEAMLGLGTVELPFEYVQGKF